MSNTIGQLDSTYLSMINELMKIERQPLMKLTETRDKITLQKSIYTDLQDQLDSLQNAAKALISTDPFYTLSPAYKAQVLGAPSGSTVLTASAGGTASAGRYGITVNTLAREQRVISTQFDSASTRLNLSGSFTLGMLGPSRVDREQPVPGTVTDFSTGAVAEGQTELASGDYFVETQQDTEGHWQFRLVDSGGDSVTIRSASDPAVMVAGWQSFESLAGRTFDTGRGLKLAFGADPAAYQLATQADVAHPAAQVTYTDRNTPKTVSFTAAASDTLVDIAGMINRATYSDGYRVSAAVVDGQLLLSSGRQGADYRLFARDDSGSVLHDLGLVLGNGALNVQQSGANASFLVNNLLVSRPGNNDLSDVIHGVTLNLASDAEGKSVTVDVTQDPAKEAAAVKTFLDAFNKLQEYLQGKLATVKLDDGTYKRGALAGDEMLSGLRLDLVRLLNKDHLNTGSFKNLDQLGIQIGDNFKVSIATPARLEAALRDNRASVSALVDAVMQQVHQRLGRFTGTTGYVSQATKSLDQQLDMTKDQIDRMNERLVKREEALRLQFGQAQAQILSMTYTSRQLGAIYGGINFSM
jgi:flagellar capping protein FliD